MALCFVCKIVSGEPKILEPGKSSRIGWFTLEEMKKLPLTLTAAHRWQQVKKKFHKGLDSFYNLSRREV